MPQLSSNFFREKLPKGGTEFLQAYNSSHMMLYWAEIISRLFWLLFPGLNYLIM